MDRIALVTGAGSGIGRAAAILLSQSGLRVVLAARGADALAATAEACPGPTLAVPADVTDPAAVDQLFGQVEHDWGPVEVLIASAGSRYNPLFYAMVGWPAQPFDGAPALYVMRLVGSLLTSLLLGLAGWVVASAFATTWPRLGLVVA